MERPTSSSPPAATSCLHHNNSPRAEASGPPRTSPINAATPAAARKPSRRSINPPCPGMTWLASLTPNRRLTADSKRSPPWATIDSSERDAGRSDRHRLAGDGPPDRHDCHHGNAGRKRAQRAAAGARPGLLRADVRRQASARRPRARRNSRKCRSPTPPRTGTGSPRRQARGSRRSTTGASSHGAGIERPRPRPRRAAAGASAATATAPAGERRQRVRRAPDPRRAAPPATSAAAPGEAQPQRRRRRRSRSIPRTPRSPPPPRTARTASRRAPPPRWRAPPARRRKRRAWRSSLRDAGRPQAARSFTGHDPVRAHEPAEPALAPPVFGDRVLERGAVEIGPIGRNENELAVGRLPHQEIRQPLLAAGADDEVGIGQIGRIEMPADDVRRDVARR